MGKEVVSPLVSIICNTYNHVNYIRQCLDGFLMQETNFPIEILVHDDASTDGTSDIVREYEDKYPGLIKPIYQAENQYSKGVKVSLKYQYSRANGKYIALCEGDDYWTDPFKLQKQVDFLDNNIEYSHCGHKFIAYHELEGKFKPFDTGIDGEYQLSDLVTKHVFCSTLSILFRRAALDLEYYSKFRYSMDIVLAYILLKNAKGFCLSDNMAVYRVHSGGVWSSSHIDQRVYNNLDVRLAVYELEKTDEAAKFILTYLKKLGRGWMIRNRDVSCKAMKYIVEQFGYIRAISLIIHIVIKM